MSGDCRCGSGSTYAACCGPVHDGTAPAVTALALMRSRFSAFALGRADHLLRTWHPDTRPRRLDLDDSVTWRRLQIVDTEAGGAEDEHGIVEFRAQYEQHGRRHILHERSRFTRTGDGAWRYLDGEVS
ncbi:YchJ family protein [Mycolicibacterium bacteremicum]|uniref:YchJ family protein n=1 Tax=Mycolicibacterium bacteremicum TaxID=564198 RepID=UPI0026F31DC3|nr:YchJ family metal-binding protein [Mycolicibacterium bacteremicum]